MIDIFVACDEKDQKLGDYFLVCMDNIKEVIQSKGYNFHPIQSDNLNVAYLEIRLSDLADKKKLFLAYSHGTEDSLLSSETYLHLNHGYQYFGQSLFYTFSCSSGIKLGPKLIESGCLAFVGYKSVVSIITTYQEIFSLCANHGIKEFIGGMTIKESYISMKEYYTEEIDNTYSKNFIVASELRQNRDSLILLGNGEINMCDFLE